MYEAVPDLATLRQGDIIRGVYFPKYSFATVRLLHSIGAEHMKFEDMAMVMADEQLAVVVSQCCEFNEGKREAFSLAALNPWREQVVDVARWGFNVARLIPVSKSFVRRQSAADPERLAKIRVANNYESGEMHHVYLFDAWLPDLAEPHVADFTQVFSIKMQDQKQVLRGKILQLDKEERRKFQLKLGAFYSRKAE